MLRPISHVYVVHGPPGTGKTRVVTQAACEIVQHRKGRVLIATPSHTAADIVAHRIYKQLKTTGKILRLLPYQRRPADVPEQVHPLVKWADRKQEAKGLFGCPTREEVLDSEVIVTTCMTAQVSYPHSPEQFAQFIYLYTQLQILVSLFWPEVQAQSSRFYPFFPLIGFEFNNCSSPRPCLEKVEGLFSHILIDEAGQATEPEIYVPMMLATPSTTIALVGDHKQLGPVVRNAKVLVFTCVSLTVVKRHANIMDLANP